MDQRNRTDRQNVEDVLMLTPLQEGILSFTLRDPESGLYLEQLCLQIASPVNVQRLTAAWNYVLAANEMLRTVFRWKQVERPVQLVCREWQIPVEIRDLREMAAEGQWQEMVRQSAEERQKPFDLEAGPLMRVQLYQLCGEHWVLVLNYHHLLFDGWSTGIILRELLWAYRELAEGREPAGLPKRRFKEYLRWLKSRNQTGEQAYWREYLAGFDTKTSLPLDVEPSRRAQQKQGTSDIIEISIPVEQAAQLAAMAQAIGVTLPTLLYAAWGLLLQRYNNHPDVLFGTTVAGRPSEIAGVEEMVGLFIQTIPVRVRAELGQTLRQMLLQLQEEQLQRQSYEYTPLLEIQAQSELVSQDGLFDSLFVVENYPLHLQAFRGEANSSADTATWSTAKRGIDSPSRTEVAGTTPTAEMTGLTPKTEKAGLTSTPERAGMTPTAEMADSPSTTEVAGLTPTLEMIGLSLSAREIAAAVPATDFTHLAKVGVGSTTPAHVVGTSQGHAVENELQITGYTIAEQTNYPLTVVVTLWEGIRFKFMYDASLMAKDTLKRWGEYLCELIAVLPAALDLPVEQIDFLPQAERKCLLDDFNATATDFPANETIVDLFWKRVAVMPEATAVVSGEGELTYAELAGLSSHLARRLQGLGVTAETLVAILTEPSLATVVGIFGILSAGGAYLPLDPHYPEERIQFMLADSEVRILLTQDKWASRLNAPAGVEVICIDQSLPGKLISAQEIMPDASSSDLNVSFKGERVTQSSSQSLPAKEDATWQRPVVLPKNLAYVIYTSGSTGRPKGVLLEHRGLWNLLMAMQVEYPTQPGDTWLLKTPYTFDVSLTELFSWVVGGGRLAILSPGAEKEPQKISAAVQEYKVTHLNFVPAMFRAYLDYLESGERAISPQLRYLMVAGEAIAQEQVKRFYQLSAKQAQSATPCRFVNLYGPTETTIYATHFPLEKASAYRSVPIGRPLANTRIYILDHEDRLQPVGFAGELCIAGAGVARGYLHLPELTRDKFIPDPYVQGERIYRTGDLARWHTDGNLEYLGRLDQQVKIRGYRIEIGEIENQLLRHPAVREAVVVDLPDQDGGRYLCAYLLADAGADAKATDCTQDGRPPIEELRQHLAKTLPEYMIPLHFVWLPAFPLTSSGKVNRKALPEPRAMMQEVPYWPPESPLEEELAQIWQEVLGVSRVGRQEHFFHMLGGHSLKAVQVVARIYKKLGREISVRELFENPTIEALAQAIMAKDQTTYAEIPLQPDRSYYPVSSAQNRLYFLQQLDPASTAYNLPAVLELRGQIDVAQIENILAQLIQRHEALRTVFAMQDGVPVQRVQESVAFALEYTELQASEDGSDAELLQAWTERCLVSFDLGMAPLLRAQLAQVGPEQYYLWLDLHHIIADGVSLDLLVREFTQLYRGESLAPLKHRYKDYAAWQVERLENGAMAAQETFWRQQFSAGAPVLELPADFRRPALQSFRGNTLEVQMKPNQVADLQQLADQHGVTQFMVLLAVYQLLLAQYSGQEEVVVGTPVAGRQHPDLQPLIGMFVNTLALRSEPTGDKSFRQYLGEVKTLVLAALEHQDYPLEHLLEQLPLQRNLGRNPLFDTVFVLQNPEEQSRQVLIPGVEICYHRVDTRQAKFDLTLFAEKAGAELTLRFEYAAEVFAAETISRMAQHFLRLAEQVATNPDAAIGTLELLSPEEKDQILFSFNDTRTPYPEKTLHQLFLEQAERTPERIALRTGEHGWSYREVCAAMLRVADFLHTRGVEPGSVVGLMTRRSAEMVVGILGILQAGGAYLPVDAGLPLERKAFILRDAGVQILLTSANVAGVEDVASAGSWECVELERLILWQEITRATLPDGGHDRDKQGAIVTLDHLAYVMYTSGSTGEPKGVMIPHRGVVRLLHNTNYIHLDENERIMQLAPYSFDASTLEIWAALLFGGTLILVLEEQVLDVHDLSRAIAEAGSTTCWLTSSLFNRLIDEAPAGLRGLKQLLVGGEALSLPHVRKALQLLPNTRLVNGYGPTENTTFTCCYEIGDVPEYWQSIPVGKPISNTRVYILNSRLKPVPVGVVGEIYIAGDGLARGYLNRPELTQERFIPVPLLPGEILYKSGDLGRYLPDGTIEFLGRRDHQVKIRGFRIELGEVEAALLKHPFVKQAVAAVKEDAEQNKYLVAYLETAAELSVLDLRSELAQTLPEYMLPNRFLLMERLPLMPNGKVDRRALPEPGAEQTLQAEYSAPRTYWEEQVAVIFAEVLGQARISRHDHFFMLGGHSLKAAQVTAQIAAKLGVKLPLRELFTHPVVFELAQVVEALKTENSTEEQSACEPCISIQPERDFYPLSSAQQRIFILQQMGGEEIAYNIPSAMLLEGPLDLERFRIALEALLERHELLRTRFVQKEGEPLQQVCKDVELDFTVTELAGEELEVLDGQLQLREDRQLYQIMETFVRPFDLLRAPLWRVQLLHFADDRYILLFDIHHIIADGFSMGILRREMSELYSGAKLVPLRLQYRDYAVWQTARLTSVELEQQKAYWLTELAGELPVLKLPTDYPRLAVQSYEGSAYTVLIDSARSCQLRQLAERAGVSLYMLFLAAYNVLLARLSGQEELIVGSPVAGRPEPEVRELVGMFVNTLALRSKVTREQSFQAVLREVKEAVLAAYEQQEYPFELLVKQLHLERDLSRHPVFDTMFDLQPLERELQMGTLSMTPCALPVRVAKFDLNLTAQERVDGIALTWTYSVRLFKAATIERFARYFERILQVVLAEPAIATGRISLLTTEERAQILYGFNNTVRSYPTSRTVNQLFEMYAENQPTEEALVVAGERLTYRELNERSNRLAHFLERNGINRETVVGIMLERSVAMIVAVLAVWKAGGAYVPVDPLYPEERIAYMLEDSEAPLLLTHSLLQSKVGASYGGVVIRTDEIDAILADEESCNPPMSAGLENLAYLIYTSGSTGKPKGVMVEHLNLLNSHYSWQEQFALLEGRPVLLQLASFSFDVFVADLCRSIVSGGRLVMATEERGSIPALYKLLLEEQVTIVNSTPGLLLPLLDYVSEEGLELPTLRHLLIGADAWNLRDYRRLLRQFGTQFKLINCYGVTEAAVDATWYRETENLPDHDGLVPIGKPIYNVQIYILDAYANPVPVGVIGEVYIGGAGVARGYWKRPALTAERFLSDPFWHGVQSGSGGADEVSYTPRLYKTGDLGRYQPDGNIDFLGRMDQQVKIRGYRIETGEIEAAILDYPAVKQAVILARAGNDGSKYLVAYYTATAEPGDAELRKHLGQCLPEYMIPEYFVRLDTLPLTLNGKIDLRALPEVRVEKCYLAPRDQVEARLAQIWESVLGVERVGIEDHFFQLGGHSLKGMILLAEIYKDFKVELSLRQLFLHPVLKDLAADVRDAGPAEDLSIPLQPERAWYPLSSAQKRLFVLHQFAPEDITYNMPVVVELEGELDFDRLNRSLQRLVQWHASLRTIFLLEGGEPVQKILPEVEVMIHRRSLAAPVEQSNSDAMEMALHQRTVATSAECEQMAQNRSATMKVALHQRAVATYAESGQLAQQTLSAVAETTLPNIAATPRKHGESDEREVTMRHREISAYGETLAAEALQIALMLRECIKPFDLQHAPLLRVELLQVAATHHLLFFDLHHIIADGVSMDILVQDLAALYAGQELAVATLEYKDFAVWQSEFLQSERMRKQEAYWLNRLGGEIPVLNLSTDFPRPQTQSTEGSNLHFPVERELWKQMQQLAETSGTTTYMLLLAAYSILLARYTGQDDLLIGSPVAGRNHPALQRVVGMFVNTLAMRQRPAGEKKLSQFLAEVREDTLSAFEHQDYPFELLVDRLHLERDASRNPLFDVAFVLQNMENAGRKIQWGEVHCTDYSFEVPVAKFALTLVAEERDGEMLCAWNYASKLFRRATMGQMAVHLCRILEAMVNEPETRIADVELLTPGEREQLIYTWNETGATYPREATIHGLFEEQATQAPEAIAVTFGKDTLTYGELNRRANQVARRLRELGVGADRLVGLMCERSFEMIVGIFGILKAGGAYVPLDPEYPSERIAFMLKDSAAPVLLTQRRLQGLVAEEYTGTVLYLDEMVWEAAGSESNLCAVSGPHHLAYIIYTSGSTGRPKGVMIEHHSVVRLLKLEPSNYDFHAGDVWTLFHSYCFDFSVWEIFGALLFGGRLVIVDAEARLDPVRFLTLLREERVTVLNQTPAAFYNLIQAELQAPVHTLHEHLRYVIFGGEALNFSKLVPWVELYRLEQIALINMYGITETTVHVTYERIHESDLLTGYRSLVGRPIYTTTLYLLDQNRMPVPVGVPGEIYVGGPGVARGYLNRPELTAERFHAHPFVSGERLYRSGDLGKFLPDGNLEYLGRIDQQVKIRGFRIEIGEIEETLQKHPAVQDVVVLPRTSPQGGHYLAAYVVPSKEDGDLVEVSVPSLKAHLQQSLPDYMIPAAFVILDHLPLTSNGKVNRKALPEPEMGSAVAYEPPRDEVEARIAVIWAKILGIEEVGIRANFFDLGGNSLLLIKVYAALQEAFPTVELKVTDLFKYPTIEALAELFRIKPEVPQMMAEDDREIEEFIM